MTAVLAADALTPGYAAAPQGSETARQAASGAADGALAPLTDYPYVGRQTYLNQAALGLSPLPVRARMQAFADGLASVGTAYYFDHGADVDRLPREGSALLFGTQPENIALTTSVSEAICQVAWGLRPVRGQNVVSIDIDIPAVTLPWMRIAQETGVEVRLAQVWSDPGSLSFESVARLVDRNTAAICVSHVQWIT